MSLFAAYADQAKESEDTNLTNQKTKEENIWLENSSFQNVLSTQTVNKDVKSDHSDVSNKSEPGVKKRKKEKRKKHKKRSREIEKQPATSEYECEEFSIDKSANKEFLTVSTISRPAVPKYHIKYYLNSSRKPKKRKFKRYFKTVLDKNADKSNSEDDTKHTKDTLSSKSINRNDNSSTFKQEEELSQTTAHFNKTLADNPNDIKTWLKYIHFQDSVYQFEKTYRKGSIAKALRVLAERKISILDKALSLNPNSQDLARERLSVAESTYPADELQKQLKDIVEKEQGNIIFWQGYIESNQCSMSHCNTPCVVYLYTKCLSVLHKIRRSATIDKTTLEENILKMLYQCGLFLKQTGLFEQLWTLLRLYLELNLDKGKFNVSSGFQENQLVELEEIIFKSQLPLHELWLRTEKLRESCHWVPYSGEGQCEDPQRMVFTEDVSELIHPITMPNNIFKLTATILTLLKVPLLPCRHVTMQELGLDHVPWSLDSLESILPVFLPLFPMNISNINILKENRLTSGPQYLKAFPGQEEYLEFILKIMINCAESLKSYDKMTLTIWWFRFQRLLIILDKLERFKMPKSLKKSMKNNIKNLLKNEENRNNEIFYCEYALIEHELGSTEKALSIIQTALSLNQNTQLATTNVTISQSKQCYLYRIMIELKMSLIENIEINKQNAVKVLLGYVLQKDIAEVTDEIIKEASLRFKLLTLQLLGKPFEKISLVEQFLPNFHTDWIMCHGWFIYLTSGPIEYGSFMEKTISKLEENENTSFQKEILYEFYVSLLFLYCSQNPDKGYFKILDDVLYRAIESYPNNLYLLGVLAQQQNLINGLGPKWWRIQSMLLKSKRALPAVFAVLITTDQMNKLEEQVVNTVTGEKYELVGHKNRILSLFKKITQSDMCTKRCGLIWRLYLQFVYTYFDAKLCRYVYYSAVEECPWLKALYIDAAIYIPAELPQIQDLIIEKELRLHVTPEELDVLRS